MYCVGPLGAKAAHSIGQLWARGFTTQQRQEEIFFFILIPSWLYCHLICADLISGRDILQRKRKGTANNFVPGVVSSTWGQKRLSASNSKADFFSHVISIAFPATVSLVMFLSLSLSYKWNISKHPETYLGKALKKKKSVKYLKPISGREISTGIRAVRFWVLWNSITLLKIIAISSWP